MKDKKVAAEKIEKQLIDAKNARLESERMGRMGCGMFRDDRPRYWKVSTYIRNTLAAGIIYMIYREAGPWTAFFAFLMLLQCEAQLYLNSVIKAALQSTSNTLKRSAERMAETKEHRQRVLDQMDKALEQIGLETKKGVEPNEMH